MKSTRNYVEEFLQQPKGVNKSWFRTMMVFLIAIIGFGILLGFSMNYGNFLGKNPDAATAVPGTWAANLSKNTDLNNAVGVISILAFCLIALPFVCWFSLWMIGINQVSRSTFFHLFMWIIASVLMVLLLCCIIMFIRASVFNPADYVPAPSVPDGGDTPPPGGDNSATPPAAQSPESSQSPDAGATPASPTRSLLNAIYEAIRY